jgi:hypothetical protein
MDLTSSCNDYMSYSCRKTSGFLFMKMSLFAFEQGDCSMVYGGVWSGLWQRYHQIYDPPRVAVDRYHVEGKGHMTLNITLEDHRIRTLQSADPNYQYCISIIYL